MAVSPDLWSVKVSRTSAFADAQLREYHFPRPSEVVEEQDRPILSFTFPRAEGRDGYGRFIEGSESWSELGAVILRPPGMSFHAYGMGGPSEILNCEFDVSSFEQLTGLRDWDPRRLQRCIDIRSTTITQTMKRIGRELEQPGFGSETLVDLLLQTLLLDLARAFETGAGEDEVIAKGGLAAWQRRRIRDMLHNSLNEWPSVQELADACGISRCHLSRSFRHSTGSTLVAYSTMVRISRAKSLLKRHDLSIASVARRLGFASTGSFSMAFRRETGVSPTAFLLPDLGEHDPQADREHNTDGKTYSH